MPAIVDYVASGSRFKLLVPKENISLTFVLSGIRAPRTARSASEKGEPYGQEALDFASRRYMQRDVEVDFEATDKTGGFIGALYLNKTENAAVTLVREGKERLFICLDTSFAAGGSNKIVLVRSSSLATDQQAPFSRPCYRTRLLRRGPALVSATV